MDLTKLQLSELMCKHAAKGNGLHDLMENMPQVQLASAKLAICLKNSVLGVEKLSFLGGLKFSLRPTLRTKLSEKSLKLDFLGMY